jgi:hypothetical protein
MDPRRRRHRFTRMYAWCVVRALAVKPSASSVPEQRIISPFQGNSKPSFLDQPASGALGRGTIALEKSDRFQVSFFPLERAYYIWGASECAGRSAFGVSRHGEPVGAHRLACSCRRVRPQAVPQAVPPDVCPHRGSARVTVATRVPPPPRHVESAWPRPPPPISRPHRRVRWGHRGHAPSPPVPRDIAVRPPLRYRGSSWPCATPRHRLGHPRRPSPRQRDSRRACVAIRAINLLSPSPAWPRACPGACPGACPPVWGRALRWRRGLRVGRRPSHAPHTPHTRGRRTGRRHCRSVRRSVGFTG